MMISILVEVLGYFLLVPFTEGVAAMKPLSLDSLAAREMMVINLLADGLGMSSGPTGRRTRAAVSGRASRHLFLARSAKAFPPGLSGTAKRCRSSRWTV